MTTKVTHYCHPEQSKYEHILLHDRVKSPEESRLLGCDPVWLLLKMKFRKNVISFIIRVDRFGKLGTGLAVTSISTLQRNTNCMERIGKLGTALAVTSI
jgi:hypothetical protein